MDHNGHPLSRRRLLAGAAAASAVTVAGVAAGPAAATAAPNRTTTPLVARDGIATAQLRTTDGEEARFRTDFHERLGAWLAFWSANSPRSWSVPVEVVASVGADGDTLTLHTVRHRHGVQLRDGFAAGRVDTAWWGTLASLHHHFPTVRALSDGSLRVVDGAAGWSGSSAQVAFAGAALRELWGERSTGWQEPANRVLRRAGHRADVASRAGWAAFTRVSLRRGLGTESYE